MSSTSSPSRRVSSAGRWLWAKSNKKSTKPELDNKMEPKVDKSNYIIQYRGVSLAHLVELRNGICQEKLAQGVRLYFVKEDIEDLDNGNRTIPSGKTILELDKVCNKKDELLGDVAYLDGNVRFNCRDTRVELKRRIDWTVEDVCERFVIPKVMQGKNFYIDMIDSSQVGEVYQGAFVSQSRATRFTDIVDGLVEHYKAKGKNDLDLIFIWIDLFGANQPLLTSRDDKVPLDVQEKREQLLHFGLHEAIRYFDERLIFLDSWMNPRPLTRAWCIWEIYGAVRSNRPLEIVLSPNEQEKFVDTLLDDYESIAQAISKMDMRNAECLASRDLEMIQSAVEEMEGGFGNLNASVIKELNNWLVRVTAKAVDALQEQLLQSNSDMELEYSKLLLQAGKLMLQQDKLKEAKSYFDKSFDLRRKYCAEFSIPIAEVLIERGNLEEKQSMYLESFETFQTAKEIFAEIRGTEEHEDVAMVVVRIAQCLYRLDHAKEGVKVVDWALDILKTTLGPRCKEVVDALYWKVWCLCGCGRTNQALEVGFDALQLAKDVFNPHHLMVAKMFTVLGEVYRRKALHEEALAADEEAIQITEENLGRDCIDGALRLGNLGLSQCALGMFLEARESQEEALNILLNICGRPHISTAWAMDRLSRTLEELGEIDEALLLAETSYAIQSQILGEHHNDTNWTKSLVEDLTRSVKRRNQELKRLPELRQVSKANANDLKAMDELSRVLTLSKRHLDEGIETTRSLLKLVETKAGTRTSNDSMTLCSVLERLGKLLETNGELDEARELFLRCVNIQAKAGKRVNRGLLMQVDKHQSLQDLKSAKLMFKDLKKKGEPTGQQAYKIASILVDLNRKLEAVPFLEEAVENTMDHLSDHKWLVELADLLIDTRKFKKAIIRLEQLLTLQQQNSGEYGDTLFKIGTVQQRMHNYEKALKFCKKAFEICDEAKISERLETVIDLLVDTDRIEEAQDLMNEMVGKELRFSIEDRMTKIQIRHVEIAEQATFSLPRGSSRDIERSKVGWMWLECGREEEATKAFLQGAPVDTLWDIFDSGQLEKIAYLLEKSYLLEQSKAIVDFALLKSPGSLSLRYALQRIDIKMEICNLENQVGMLFEEDPQSATKLFDEFDFHRLRVIETNTQIDTALQLVEMNAPGSLSHGKLLFVNGLGHRGEREIHLFARALEVFQTHLESMCDEDAGLWEVLLYLGACNYFVNEQEGDASRQQSEELLESAFQLTTSHFGPGSIETGVVLEYLVQSMNEKSIGLDLLNQALSAQHKEGRENHHFVVVGLLLEKAACLVQLESHDQAFFILQKVRQLNLREGFHEKCEKLHHQCVNR